jgi:mRNA interferase RelE/StbE
MMYRIEYTKSFERGLKKLSLQEQRTVAKKLKLLMVNPYYPSLRTKKVQGFDNLFECSVNMDIRILWRYRGESIIVTLDVGHHSIIDKI